MEVNFIIASILILLSICSCIANLILAHYQMNTDCEQVTHPLLICAIIGIFLVSVIYGFLPYFFNKHCHHKDDEKPLEKSEIFVSLLNCFAGGIIFGLCILGIWNDTEKQFHKNFQNEDHYPWVKMLVGVGFLLMFLIDELVSSAFSISSISCEPGGPPKRKMTIMNFDFDPHDLSRPNEDVKDETTEYIHDVTLDISNHVPTIGLEKSHSIGSTSSNITNPRKMAKHIASSLKVPSLDTEFLEATTFFQSATIQESKSKAKRYKKMERTLQITLVISTFLFHSFLEGLVLGIEWNPENVVHMFFIIVIHKSMLMWNAGVTLCRRFHASFKSFLLSLVLLSVATPLSALITYLIQRYQFIEHYDQSLFNTALHCFSISMFLFLAIFEIMAQEQQKKYSNFLKMIAYVTGFAVIAIFVKVLEIMHKRSEKTSVKPLICG